ncbi:MAG: hypothetical protein V4560_10670 [Bacteroidota bacterium]
MKPDTKRNIKKSYLETQYKIETQRNTFFKSEVLIFGFFGWKLYVFNNLNELLIWYSSIDKVFTKSDGLEDTEIITNYIPVCFSKIEISNFAINKKSVLKIEQYLLIKDKDSIYIKRTIDSIFKKTHIFKKLFNQYSVKYYGIAQANHSIKSNVAD